MPTAHMSAPRHRGRLSDLLPPLTGSAGQRPPAPGTVPAGGARCRSGLFWQHLDKVVELVGAKALPTFMSGGVAAKLGTQDSCLFLQELGEMSTLAGAAGVDTAKLLKRVCRNSPLVHVVGKICAYMRVDLVSAVARCAGTYSKKKAYAQWLRSRA